MRRNLQATRGHRSSFRKALALAFGCFLVGVTVKSAASSWESGGGSEGRVDAAISHAGQSALRVITKAATKAVFAVSF
jgi:hypothetical protein